MCLCKHKQGHQQRHCTCAITHSRTLLQQLRTILQDRLDRRDQLARQAIPDRQAQQVLLAGQDHREYRGQLAIQVHKVQLDRKAYKGLLAQPDGLVRKEYKAQQVIQDRKVSKAQLAQLGGQDLKDPPVRQGGLDHRVSKDRQAQLEQLAQQDQPDRQDQRHTQPRE